MLDYYNKAKVSKFVRIFFVNQMLVALWCTYS